MKKIEYVLPINNCIALVQLLIVAIQSFFCSIFLLSTASAICKEPVYVLWRHLWDKMYAIHFVRLSSPSVLRSIRVDQLPLSLPLPACLPPSPLPSPSPHIYKL